MTAMPIQLPAVARRSELEHSLGKAGGFLVIAFVLGLFVAGVPVILDDIRTPCDGAGCQEWQRPADQKITSPSRGTFAVLYVVREGIFLLGYCLIAGVILWRAGQVRMASLGAIALVAFASSTVTDTVIALGRSNDFWRLPVQALTFAGMTALIAYFFGFPDGRFVPGWTRWATAGWVVLCGIAIVVPRTSFAYWYGKPFVFAFLVMIALVVVAQVFRYRRVSTPTERQQTKWVVFGFTTAFAGFFASFLILPLIDESVIPNRPLFAVVGMSLSSLSLLGIPIAVAVAMLRHRLWDIDVIVNRTLLSAAMTATVVGAYVALVVGIGAVLPFDGHLVLSILATGIVAVLFQPIRERVQRALNRLLYGDRVDPYTVLSRLGHRLEGTIAHDAVLGTIVETVAQALRVPYVAISLYQGGTSLVTASYGVAASNGAPLDSWRLVYAGETVGDLSVATRGDGEAFAVADRRLLDDIARRAGVAVHAVRMTADLEQARQRLVTAREEERRRLRRDLHDGLGPQLASQSLTLDAARKIMRHDPAAADALLDELRGHMQAAVEDVRRLVYALRPPVLDDLGLIAAIRSSARSYERANLAITVSADFPAPSLPAAVEVAAYRIVLEALTNVVRHAGATACSIDIALDATSRHLSVDITDNGRGLPLEYRPGVGLLSIRERAAELGGTANIARSAGRGTRIQVSLPLLEDFR